MVTPFRALVMLAAVLLAQPVLATNWRLGLETGAVWQSRNDVRIPGDTGTRFALDAITGAGPDAFVRIEADWDFAGRHGVRLVYAPLSVESRGRLPRPIDFVDTQFEPGPARVFYRFDAPRLTYRYRILADERRELRLGVTGLVRNAEIRLEQGARIDRDTDVGFVPLLHAAGHYRVASHWHLAFDLDALAAPQGRAFDLGVRLEHRWPSGWDAFAGYRTLEGGVDNDDVFNFSWFHYAVIGIARRL